MKWKSPENCDRKTVRRFLFSPLSIKGVTRWLEWVDIEYQYKEYSTGGGYWHRIRVIGRSKNSRIARAVG